MKTILKLFVAIVVFVATTAVNKGDESLMKILAKERKEMRELFQRETKRLAEDDRELRQQVKRQNQEILDLHDQNRRLHQKLRHAVLETKKAARQNDQRENLNMKKVIQTELQNSIISRGQNDSLELELKKFIKEEINEFLKSDKICVGGWYSTTAGFPWRKKIDFGYTFPRRPTVVVSINWAVHNCGAQLKEVTNSYANIDNYCTKFDGMTQYIAWMACL